MENREAIEILKRLQAPEPWEPQLNSAAYGALDMAIAALEKQEGKKPEETGLMGVHIPVCANCKNPIMFITESARSDFCPKCGQRIDWSDEYDTD